MNIARGGGDIAGAVFERDDSRRRAAAFDGQEHVGVRFFEGRAQRLQITLHRRRAGDEQRLFDAFGAAAAQERQRQNIANQAAIT